MILVDSNVWIFAETKGTAEHYLAIKKLQERLSEGVAINPIIFSEVFHKLSLLFDPVVARTRVETIIHHPAVEWIGITREQAVHALQLSVGMLLRINDALIAQHALELDLPILTDNVKDFKKVSQLKLIPLR